jgi:selenocysteine lyase/cysteine desulfurase
MGATFDSSGIYRFNAIRRMLDDEGLTTGTINRKIARQQRLLLDALEDTPLGAAELLNPPDGKPHARFLALRHRDAPRWYEAFVARNCITDVRGDVLRVGLGLYHDDEDILAFAAIAGELQ